MVIKINYYLLYKKRINYKINYYSLDILFTIKNMAYNSFNQNNRAYTNNFTNINKLQNQYNFEYINNIAYSNNNMIFSDIVTKLEKILNDIYNRKEINVIVNQLKTIIFIVNNIMKENKSNMNQLEKKIENLNNSVNDVKQSLDNNKKIIIYTVNYLDGNYIGEIKNGMRDGRGIRTWNDGERYEGDWKNDKRDGKGVYTLKNGEKYEGDYKNGEMDGKGIYYYKNGNRYEGDWKNGKINGKGIFYYNNGNREMGDFLNDHPIGKHVTLHVNGEISAQFFKY